MTKLKFLTLIAGFAVFFGTTGAVFSQIFTENPLEKKVSPPSHIFYDDKDLRYNPDWKSKEIYLEANLDEKPGNEVIINFMASYKPRTEISQEKKDPFDTTQHAVPIVQNYAFTQLYHQDAGGHFQCVKTINGMERPQSFCLLFLDKQNPPALAVINPGGEDYTEIIILRWQDGGYRTLLKTSGSGNAEILSSSDPVSLRIGSQEWRWNNSNKMFEEIRPVKS